MATLHKIQEKQASQQDATIQYLKDELEELAKLDGNDKFTKIFRERLERETSVLSPKNYRAGSLGEIDIEAEKTVKFCEKILAFCSTHSEFSELSSYRKKVRRLREIIADSRLMVNGLHLSDSLKYVLLGSRKAAPKSEVEKLTTEAVRNIDRYYPRLNLLMRDEIDRFTWKMYKHVMETMSFDFLAVAQKSVGRLKGRARLKMEEAISRLGEVIAFLEINSRDVRMNYLCGGAESRKRLEREKTSFSKNLTDLIPKFAGMYVWFEDGMVQDYDSNDIALIERVYAKGEEYQRALLITKVPGKLIEEP